MTNIYENVVDEFTKRGCQLLTTKEEHIGILKYVKNKLLLKYNYCYDIIRCKFLLKRLQAKPSR